MTRRVLSIVFLLFATGSLFAADLKGVRSALIYYGSWNASHVAQFKRYNLIALHLTRGPALPEQRTLVAEIRRGTDGAAGTPDDVLVLGYISIGEDERTFGSTPVTGDGRGPVYFRDGQVVFENRGVASYYLDEWDAGGISGGRPIPDGVADRHGDFGGAYVDAGHPDWQAFVLGTARADEQPFSTKTIASIGYDGFFLDTPDVAAPWYRYGWTARGLSDLIRRIDEAHPDKILLLNRGLFYFMPMFRFQYASNPRKWIDAVLFESYFLDSAYGSAPFNFSPYFDENKNLVSPKLNAELGRPDSNLLILNLDYASDPNGFARTHSDIYREAVNVAVVEQGRVEMISDRFVSSINTVLLDNPPPPDRAPPVWQNTTSGYIEGTQSQQPDFMVAGDADTAALAPRVGIQKAIPGDREVTLRWDVAIDQTRRVKYNVYVSNTSPVDPATATVLKDVQTALPLEYTVRSFTRRDDVCPYEYTVKNLPNGVTTYFLIRAEDSTVGATGFQSGRIGPNGGLEETNTNELAAVPGPMQLSVVIDGLFSDWNSVPPIRDRTLDAPSGGQDWKEFRAVADSQSLHVYVATADGPIAFDSSFCMYINSDEKSYVGYAPKKGADFLIRGGKLYRYTGSGRDWKWTELASISFRTAGRELELTIPKALVQPANARVEILLEAFTTESIRRIVPFEDWTGQPTVEEVIDDNVSRVNDASTDVLSALVARDRDTLFVRVSLAGVIDPTFATADYYVFLDADNNVATGFRTTPGSLGADFMAFDGALWRHTGINQAWGWERINGASVAIQNSTTPSGLRRRAARRGPGSRMEIAFDRRVIGWTDDLAGINILVGAADSQDRYDFLPALSYPSGATGDRFPDPPGTAVSLLLR